MEDIVQNLEDIKKLTVSFGGFTPMPLKDVDASKEQIEKMEIIYARMREDVKRAREIERNRTSGPYYELIGQTDWRYVVLDDSVAVITGCETSDTELVIPIVLGEKPVTSIAPDGCSGLDTVESIVCGNHIASIGLCAFRQCKRLKRLFLPDDIEEFSSTWFQQCNALEEIVLPGRLKSVDNSLFDVPNLKRVYIGRDLSELMPGMFEKSVLDEIVIDSKNPFLKSDGKAIYTKDGRTLLALACPLESYEVASGCETLGKKSFGGIVSIATVVIPDSVRTIQEFTFSHSGIRKFEAPPELKEIGDKAFYYCRLIESASLNPGLESIGNEAFAKSGLTELVLPASIKHLGERITAFTNCSCAGENPGLRFEEGSRTLFFDEYGGLYRHKGEGYEYVRLYDDNAVESVVLSGTEAICEGSFARHDHVQSVVIPEGVTSIQDAAFKGCRSLQHVEIPDSLEYIGEEAFFETSIASFSIPRNLTSIGANALVSIGAAHAEVPPSIKHVSVDPENPVYYVRDALLFEKTEKGPRLLLYTGEVEDVVIPADTASIAPYAFNGAKGVRSLTVNTGIRSIGTCGLTVGCWIETIVLHLDKPIEEHDELVFKFPETSRSRHSISLAFGSASWINVPELMKHYDNCIANGHDYDARTSDGIDVYDQVVLILERVKDPVLLTKTNKGMYDRILRNRLDEICVEITRHDDRKAIDDLVDLGYLNADNIVGIIERIGRMQDAAMTGYLLEVQRMRFSKPAFDDFDL